jgi:hypothetical protein
MREAEVRIPVSANKLASSIYVPVLAIEPAVFSTHSLELPIVPPRHQLYCVVSIQTELYIIQAFRLTQ